MHATFYLNSGHIELSRFMTWQRFPASNAWTEARWVTPAVPDDVDGLSFGISIGGNGSLSIDDLGIDDAAPSN